MSTDKLIRALERVTVGELKPDLTFILDVPAEVGLERARHRRGDAHMDRFEAESLSISTRSCARRSGCWH